MGNKKDLSADEVLQLKGMKHLTFHKSIREIICVRYMYATGPEWVCLDKDVLKKSCIFLPLKTSAVGYEIHEA